MAAAQTIVEGTYKFPPNTDLATKLLLDESAHIYAKISSKELDTYFTVDDFQFYWQQQNERISLSFSRIHMGHYKDTSYNKDLSLLHTSKLTLHARMGIPLDRWVFGVTVLIEKICGNNYINKLCAICLF